MHECKSMSVFPLVLPLSIDRARFRRFDRISGLCSLICAGLAVFAPLTLRAATASSVTDGPITWTFNTSYTVGQFINGEWWALDPDGAGSDGVVITATTRPNATATLDGTMLNPGQSGLFGFDNRQQSGGGAIYAASSNLANSFPATINVASGAQSVVSMISRNSANNRCVNLDTRVLTIVTTAPAATDFRPAYAPGPKTIYSGANLQTNLIPSLPPLSGTPSFNSATNLIGPSVWLDVSKHSWGIEQLRPYNAMNLGGPESSHYYAADRGSAMGAAMCAMGTSAWTSAEKRALAIRITQIGIDFHGDVLAGGYNGYIGGSMGMGTLLPIVFAGKLLNNSTMINVTTTCPQGAQKTFQECSQPIYLTTQQLDATRSGAAASDNTPTFYDNAPYVTGYGGTITGITWLPWNQRGGPYGYPVWREAQLYNLYQSGKVAYQGSSYESFLGIAAAAMLYDLREEFAHEALFDYVDKSFANGLSGTHGNAYNRTAWAAYRYYGTAGDGGGGGTSGTVPNVPSVLSATASSTTQIDLAWADSSSDEDAFVLQRSLTSGSGFSTIASPAANAISYGDTGRSLGTTYYYRIASSNEFGLSAFSTVASAATPLLPQAAAPVASLPSGNYLSPVSVALSTSTSGATIRYTTNGSMPTASSPLYSSPLVLASSVTLRAVASKLGSADSPASTLTYQVGTFVSGSSWTTVSVPAQTGVFDMSFVVTPNANNIDGVTGLSPQASIANYTDLAVIVRLNENGFIDARNGGLYQAVNSIPYSAGVPYRVALSVNVTNRAYSATISAAGGPSVILATNFAFRSEQSAATVLRTLGFSNEGGTHTISEIVIGVPKPSKVRNPALTSSN